MGSLTMDMAAKDLVSMNKTAPRSAETAQKPLLVVDKVTLRYGGAGGTLALDGTSLDVAPNEFCVIVGPSGCGKSTLLYLIAGLVDVTSGRIMLDGRAGVRFRLHGGESLSVAYMFQHMSNAYTALENPGVDSHMVHVAYAFPFRFRRAK